MPGQVWGVIGGGDKGGIVVRQGQDTGSELLAERLYTGAVVKELDLQGDRLNFEKLQGGGPSTGWVSVKLQSGTPLLAKGDDLWSVVGGGDKGGILVREGQDTASSTAPERLSTGALVQQLSLEGVRLQYQRLSGSGPATGWVSTHLQDKQLMRKLPASVNGDAASSLPAQAATSDRPSVEGQQVTGPPLEIVMKNEELGFTYEDKLPWVAEAAAVAKLFREKKPYLPTPQQTLERISALKLPLPDFKKLTPKKLKEMFSHNLPGCLYGLPFPHTADQMKSDAFGSNWLTKAMHAARTLPKDNEVSKLVRVQELSIDGFKKDGGAGMKCLITVEYAKPDRNLHTELFAKYSYDPTRDIPGTITLGQDDSAEVITNATIAHLFPFRTPKFYWGDVCRETAIYMIIWEAIPYSKRDHECKPYDILPGLGKCQDFLLPNPADYYFKLFGAMGQLAAWDKLGRFNSIFGAAPTYDEAAYLQATKQSRQPQSKHSLEMTQQAVAKMVDRGIDFVTNWAKNIIPKELHDMDKLLKMKEEILQMCPYFKDLSNYYQENCSDYIAANHANLQADNSFFWRDEYGDLSCGVLDWGGFARSPFCVRFLGCLSGADADDLLAHEEGILKCFVDEYERCGGPKVPVEEVVLRWHLAYITFAYDCSGWIERHVTKETSQEEFLSFTGMEDERFQERFYTRCGSMPTINCFTYYIKRGNLKAIFDEWAAGKGKQYLTEYV